MSRRALLGHRVRRLRRDQGLTQAEMAERLAISPSYLALIEGNNRPVTVDLLLRIGQVFDVDLQSFAEDDAERLAGQLQEAFADPLLQAAGVGRQDAIDLAQAAPAAARGLIALWRARTAQGAAGPVAGAAAPEVPDSPALAIAEAEEAMLARDGHVPEIEALAEEAWRTGGLAAGALEAGLGAWLDATLTVRVKVMPAEVMGQQLRRYDRHGRRLLLSEMLEPWQRAHEIAAAGALIGQRALLDRLAAEALPRSEAARRLFRLRLADAFALAVLMPYDRMFRAATALRYDTGVLARRFDVGEEAVFRRLATLHRPGARGVPFFLLVIDAAGTILERAGPGRLAFLRGAERCPRWPALTAPAALPAAALAELPDGSRHLLIWRRIEPALGSARDPRPPQLLMLGCEAAHAAQVALADGLDIGGGQARPIGLACRLCERLACPDRAAPPLHHRLVIDEAVRAVPQVGWEPA